MNESKRFWIGLIPLAGLSFFVPRILGMHPALAFVCGMAAAWAYVAIFTHHELRKQEQASELAGDDEERW